MAVAPAALSTQRALSTCLDWPLDGRLDPEPALLAVGDARSLPVSPGAVDCIITSPPYWKKRDYAAAGQLGQEESAADYALDLFLCLEDWKRILAPHGSVFLNVGDTYEKQGLAGIPFRIEAYAASSGWTVRNRIIWAKSGGIPEPSQRRLANRHEYILHFVREKSGYYYDAFGYSTAFWNGTSPGDVWQLPLERRLHPHLAPFPAELVERAISLGAPFAVCTRCNEPRRRIVERTFELDMSRPQARRAMAKAREGGLTEHHLRAVQATGISDAGKALKIQTGTGRNSAETQKLAAHAKRVLGGYFREFTFAKKRSAGWSRCDCGVPFRPGSVLDPFAGTGTTVKVASRLGFNALGFDLSPHGFA